MAVKVKQYSTELERQLAKGLPTKKAQAKAVVASSNSPADVQARTYQRPSATSRAILSMLKKFKGKKKPTEAAKTVRTKSIERDAKENFGTDLAAELAKLRKKGQGK